MTGVLPPVVPPGRGERNDRFGARDLRVDLIAIGARPVRMPAFMVAPTRYRLQRDALVPVLAVTLAGELARAAEGRGWGESMLTASARASSRS